MPQPYDYTIRPTGQSPIRTASGLIGLQGAVQQQQQQQAEQQRQAQFRMGLQQLDPNDPAAAQALAQQYPGQIEQIQGFQGFANEQQQMQVRDAVGGMITAAQSGDPELLQQTIDQYAPVISGTGDPSITPEVLKRIARNKPEAFMKMMQGSYGRAGGDLKQLGIFDPSKTKQTKAAAIQEFEQYQALKETNPEAAKQFGIKTGFLTPDGKPTLSSHLEKRLSTASDASIESGNNSRSFIRLADDFEGADVGGGLFQGEWNEKYKEITGTPDAITNLRKRYNSIVASQAVSNLPPGAASDKDIALALDGFPGKNATGKQISSFLRGLSKIEAESERFNSFQADYISNNRSEINMVKEWKSLRKQEDEEFNKILSDLPTPESLGLTEGQEIVNDQTGDTFIVSDGKWTRQ